MWLAHEFRERRWGSRSRGHRNWRMRFARSAAMARWLAESKHSSATSIL